ncbi:MAG: PQQ-binding-like beta-propeller repeat protein [Tabrizicola sp.]|uniref:outer membrane protein assembly factor BamB family protein n=1 Tax=Tabrizicola sp. TaxID=2005166 RepID=UPI002ABC8FA1|nr:PQQ-binding-like beta-propeller repeat protein [Tabrizicola sp.]MDZ4086408.1 PQQ-binding-like beta-propeller repeat protein [Tabrizicola sp.]
MKVRQMGGRLVTGIGLLALLAACGQREVILSGERFPVRADLAASVPVEGQPAPTAPAAPENLSVAISLGPQTGGDWTHRAGNARHLMPHAALSATPQRVWSANIGSGSNRKNRISVAPVVADGRIYTIDSGTGVTATSTSGGTLWSTDLTASFDKGGGQSSGGLATAGGRVYATTGYGELVALDAASGAVIWRQRVDAPISGAPATDGEAVYVSGRDGSAWAINAADGKVIWQVIGTPGKTAYVGSAAPTIGDRAVIFPSAAGDLMAVLKIGGGTKVWQSSLAGKRLGRAYALTADVTGDAVIAGKTIFAGTGNGRTVAMSASSGERIWSAGEGALGPVAVAGGSLFLVNDEAKLVRLDASTGEVIWAVEMPYFTNDKPKRRKGIFAHYGPVLAGGRIMVVSSDGLLRAFDPTDGTLAYTAEIPGGAAAQPAVAGGTMYVVGGNGQLHAFR